MAAPATEDPPRLLEAALGRHRAGRLGEAALIYRRILAVRPDAADGWHLLGVLARQRGGNGIAVPLISRAIAIDGEVAPYHFNLGGALADLGRFAEAAGAFAAVIRLAPEDAEAQLSLGNCLLALGRRDDAAAAYRAAIRLRPDCAEAHYNLGGALLDLGRCDEAAAAYRAAIGITADYARAYANLGLALRQSGRYEPVRSVCKAALTLAPDQAAGYFGLGCAEADLGAIDGALAAYDRAIRIAPTYAEAHSNRLLTLHYRETDATGAIYSAARSFGRLFDRLPVASVFANPPDPQRRLRVGYVSGDFGHHPVGYFLAPVLANHSPAEVELFCYSSLDLADGMTATLRAAAAHWRNLAGVTDEAAARMVAADAIDILVDLSGHTAHNRLAMFALKPAPLQVTWLGYFGTTGLAAMDYILADRFVLPDSAGDQVTERICRLPDSYLCLPTFGVALAPARRPPGGPLVFGSFNHLAKISPATVGLWSGILERLPGSRLRLKTRLLGDRRARQSLIERFAGHGIGGERLVLEGAAPRAELLAAYHGIDLALDPTPYGGGMTTMEALWMGVPVVTLSGGGWVGRVGESILSTAGLRELVAATPRQYVDLAVGLAADRRRLTDLRSGLRDRLRSSPLGDGAGFTRALEGAYRRMWRDWCAGTRHR